MNRNSRCRSLLFLAALVVHAILGSSAALAQLRITEVTISTRNVEVTNFGTASVDVSTWFFCARFTYTSLTGSIDGGASRQFTVSSLNQTSSDLGLYNSSAFGTTTAMQDFLEWGGAGLGRESVAGTKGIWTAGNFLTVPTTGMSFHARGLSTSGVRNGNWFVGRPHAGFPVPPIALESIALSGGEWHIVAFSYYLPGAHRVDVNSDLGAAWQQVTPVILDLGSGRLDFRFPATGLRQFARLRAEF